MDEERRRKIEAGRSKWAEYKKKKAKNAKQRSPPDAVLSRVHEKSCPVDPGGTSSMSNKLNFEESALENSLQSQKYTELQNEVLNKKPFDDEHTYHSNNISLVMESQSQHGISDNQSNLLTDSENILPGSSLPLASSSSVDSLTLERNADESEVSSGSDNSTITGISTDFSKSDSTTENESTEKSFPVPKDDIQKSASLFPSRMPKDNQPDEEKLLESIPTEEKEKDVLVEEILVLKESFLEEVSNVPVSESEEKSIDISSNEFNDKSETSLIVDVETKDRSCIQSEGPSISLPNLLAMEDDPLPFFSPDETEIPFLFDFYQQKIKKYQEAVQKRDSIISKLSSTLESTMNANQVAHSAGNTDVEKLKDEITSLQVKMKEMAGLLKRQKSKNGNLEYENSACQTEAVVLSKCDSGIQVETSFYSLLLNCDLDEKSFFELFVNKFSFDSKPVHQTVQILKELLLTNYSTDHVQELMTLLKDEISFQSDVPVKTECVSRETNTQCFEDLDSASVLRKMNSLTLVAKLIESLISISSGGANDTFSDFSPSKFQSFYLRRLHSMDSSDILPEMSESESVMSDINYAEVETLAGKPAVDSKLSVERLRRKNISEDFSLVTDFLQEEMDRICSFIPSISAGPQGDIFETTEKAGVKGSASGDNETNFDSDHQKILLHKSKLEARIKNLKTLDRELHEFQQVSHHVSVDSDTMTMSEDNLMNEELPLSCISLLSLTDSEYKGENIMTDSDTNFSRKVSLDMTRSMQEREFCIRCERNVDLLKEKHENDIINIKSQFEYSFSSQKAAFIKSLKYLNTEIKQLKCDKENLKHDFNKQIESLCSDSILKLKMLSEEFDKEISQLKASKNEIRAEKDELEIKMRDMLEKLTFSDKKIQEILDEKTNSVISLQNQIADLIQEHEQDLETLRLDNEASLNIERKHLENNYKSSMELLKKVHQDEIDDIKQQIRKEYEEREQNILNEHAKTLSMIEAAHCDESAVYQKKIEQLLEEKCELLTKTTQEYENILNKNHKALEILCKQLLAKINNEKDRILNESLKNGADLNLSVSALEKLNNSLENGLLKFLNQNYFINNSIEEFSHDETEYLPIEMSNFLSEEHMPPKKKSEVLLETNQKEEEKCRSKSDSPAEPRPAISESSLDSDEVLLIHTELNRLQEEFQKDITFYKEINDQLHSELLLLKKRYQELENQKENLDLQLQEKTKELASKESLLSDMNAAAVKGGSQLSATDIRSWQVQAAQTNSRLLHVLSDLVKTFMDIENDINAHLLEYGLTPSRSGSLIHHDDETGQSVGSREDFTSLSLGDCTNLDLTEDGPDLTPRACDVFIPGGTYDTDLEGEDVVLGASRRLRLAVDHVLNLLDRALENLQSHDLKLLLKRNEELSHELQEESQGRDAVHMELVTAESTVRKLELEKQKLEDMNRDLKDNYEILKRELNVERNKVSHIEQEKETALDEIHTLKEQCELLASRLGDPEKKLLEVNSRLSSEKHAVQKNHCKERQSFLDRLHQMEIALEELNAEKDDLVEKKCKEIRDLKAEMEAMEKQLQSNRKFIEQQALEREQEREEFMNKISKMEEFVKEKERIQSSESQMKKEIEELEELLRKRIEDHTIVMSKKDEVEKDLRHSLDRINDLQDIIKELEKQLTKRNLTITELNQKLSTIYESLPSHDKSNSHSDSGDSSKHLHSNNESMQQLDSLKEQIASKSQEIEMMSQSQTLLHELRGQIHFLEAKVEQRVRQLESSFLSAASSPAQSGATSPSGSQDSEPLQIPCEDGWEMSPRSIHWLEVRRLEEKLGRIFHIDEEFLKKNKELEQQLKKTKALYTDCQHENTVLQEKLSEALVQISALKSHIDEQKHRCSTPQKSHSFTEKIEELQENLEKHIENNKKLASDLKETQSTVSMLQDEIRKKEEIIITLRKSVENQNQENSFSSESSGLSAIEDLKNQLGEKVKQIYTLEKENEEFNVEIDYLKAENKSLKKLLEEAEKDIETERAQVETLCEEIGSLSENAKDEAVSISNYQNMDGNEFSEAQDNELKIKGLESHLKQKNLEIMMLKATVTKLESSLRVSERQLEIEKVLVETLQQELGSLTSYQKRLEQDYNTVQGMMQQKEMELATLHEETEAQMKLEAEIENLEKKLADQKNIESELRRLVKDLKHQLSITENIKEEIEKRDKDIKNLKENHNKELEKLYNQIEMLKKFGTSSDTGLQDIQDLAKNILDAAETFAANEDNSFQEVLISLLKNFTNSFSKKLEQKHEEHITTLSKSWQEKIKEEIENKQNYFNSETEKLQKTFHLEKENIRAEKDAFWQEKMKDFELQLEKEKNKCKVLSESAKLTKNELQDTFTNELTSLQQTLENTLKEKLSLENVIKVLNNELERLRKVEEEQKNVLAKEYETKLSAISRTIKESFESEREKILASCQQKIDAIQKDLELRLEQEENMKLKHKEELSAVHKYFETRWTNEVQKLKEFQSQDLKRIKDNSEKVLQETLKKALEENSKHIDEEKQQILKKHQQEIELMLEKFEKEKQHLIEMESKAIKDTTEILEKRFNKNLAEIQKNLSSPSNVKIPKEQNYKNWEEEKLKLIASHRKQLSALRQELTKKYEQELQIQSAAHNAEIKRLEETYNMQVEEVHELIKEAKKAASKTGYSDVGSNRTTTPSSDMTSSDEACSSCQEDMLSVNKHILVDKIHQDGKRVLSLIESSAQPFASVKEAHLWLEERKWIINKLKVVYPTTTNVNLKSVINDLIDDVQKFRLNFVAALDENSELKEKYDDLKRQMSVQNSKLCDIMGQLEKQKATNCELESLLSVKTSELSDIKIKVLEASRFIQDKALKETLTPNGSSKSSSHEMDGFRSADEPKSAEKFSLFLPDIANSPVADFSSSRNKIPYTQEEPPGHKFDSPPFLSTRNLTPPDLIGDADNELCSVKERLLSMLTTGSDSTDMKLHGLYWVFLRSQSYNKALIYQKKYLLCLLKGFLSTERVTLAWLKNMNSNDSSSPSNNSQTSNDSPLHGKSRFRAASYVIIALQRMRFNVKRWRKLARIPSSQVIQDEVRFVFQNYNFLSPAPSPGSYHHSSTSLLSVPLCFAGRGCKSSQKSSSRAEIKTKNSKTPDKTQLIEYVHRLEELQKQLGLDSLR